MKNIVLLCAAGMSTSLLVTKMKEAADKKGFECEINAYPMSEAAEKGKDADAILLGPQVQFNLNKVKAMFPDKIVDAIDMQSYGRMDGESVLMKVLEVIQ